MTKENSENPNKKYKNLIAGVVLTSVIAGIAIFQLDVFKNNEAPYFSTSSDMKIFKEKLVVHINLRDIKNKKLDTDIEEIKVINYLSSIGHKNIISVLKSPIDGLYEASTDTDIVYITSDLKYIIKGDIFNNSNNVNETSLSKKIIGLEKSISDIYNNKDIAGDNILVKKETNIKQESNLQVIKQPVISEVKINEDAQVKLNNTAINNLSALKNGIVDNELSEYRAKLEKRIKDRMNKNRGAQPDLSHNSQSMPATPKSKDGPRINLNKLQVGDAFVQYNGTQFQKVGFSKSGGKLTAEQTKFQVQKMYESIEKKGDKWSVVYPAKGKEKMGIVVFSDPTCGYCRNLHKSVEKLTEMGVTVRYLMYPRTLALGDDDPRVLSVLNTMESIWCSANPGESLDDVYAGKQIPGADCSILKEQGRSNFPAKEHYFIGQLFSLTGTPMTFTSKGNVFQGYPGLYGYIQELGL